MTQSVAIVDDDSAIRRLLRIWLERDGFSVSDYPDAQTAIDGITSASCDLACVDLGLSDMPGLELVQYLSQADVRLKIIVLSGRTESEIIAKAKDAGACDYLVKPTNSARVVSAVTRALR